MFGLATGLYNAYLAPAKLSILVVGVDGAGKTALLERVKVTQFSSRADITQRDGFFSRRHSANEIPYCHNSSLQSSSGQFAQGMGSGGESSVEYRRSASVQEGGTDATERRKMRLFCPAPRSYRPSATVAEDDDVIIVPILPIDQMDSTNESSSSISNGNVSNGEDDTNIILKNGVDKTEKQQIQNQKKALAADCDLRKGAKMFPLRMVRPTQGMNIGKVDMCGCKCNFWDLGGAEKMRILWERYYADADAVVFVVDSVSTKSKLEESREAFFHIMDKEVLDGVPFYNLQARLCKDRRRCKGSI